MHTYSIHTWTHTYIHTSMHKYKHTVTYIQTYIHAYMHTFRHTYIHTYIHTDRHTYLDTYIWRAICKHAWKHEHDCQLKCCNRKETARRFTTPQVHHVSTPHTSRTQLLMTADHGTRTSWTITIYYIHNNKKVYMIIIWSIIGTLVCFVPIRIVILDDHVLNLNHWTKNVATGS